MQSEVCTRSQLECVFQRCASERINGPHLVTYALDLLRRVVLKRVSWQSTCASKVLGQRGVLQQLVKALSLFLFLSFFLSLSLSQAGTGTDAE